MIFRILIVLVINISVGTGLHALSGIVQGVHGAPSFLTPSFAAFGILSSLLLIGAYLLMGYRIPVKSRVLRGVIFILLFWASDYLSQILGTFGAKSSILNAQAFSITTIFFDTVGYFVTGIFMGLLLDIKTEEVALECSDKKLILACIASMFLFAGIAFSLELILGSINHDLLGYVAFGIREEEKISYYVVFYLFQAFSGLLFPIFYRLTEYNSEHFRKWLWFANVYGLMLWAPIVLIVIFFGVPVLPTIAFTIILLSAIYADSAVFAHILRQQE
jgi:MFS family permease